MDYLIKAHDGITVIAVKKVTPAQTFNASINVRVGSAYETEENSGVSHYLEHAVFLGTKNHPSRELVEENLLSFGGDYNAYTSVNHTSYMLSGPLHKLGKGIDTLCDLALNPLLDNECELKKEKKVVSAELLQELTETGTWADQSQVAYEKLFPKSPVSRSILGSKKSLRNLNRVALQEFHGEHYQDPAGICITVVSPEDPETTFSRVKFGLPKLYAQAAKAPLDFKVKEFTPLSDVACIKTASYTWEFDYYYQYETPTEAKAKVAIKLLNLVLFHSEASYIYGNARKKGLIYTTSGGSDVILGNSVYRVNTNIARDKIEKFSKLYHSQIAHLFDKGIDHRFFEMCKSYYAYHCEVSKDKYEQYAYRLLAKNFLDEDNLMPAEEIEQLAKITQEDLLDVLKIIYGAPRKILTVKGPEATPAMEKELRTIGHKF